MTLRTALLLLLFIMLPTAAAEDAMSEQGLVLRDSDLQAEPTRASAVISRLVSGSSVDVIGRKGLWMFVQAAGDDTGTRGWMHLTALRLTGVRSNVTPAKNSFGAGFARLSRSVGGLFGGLRGRGTRTTQVATIGVRGLTPAELNTARFDQAALDTVMAAAATSADAEYFAHQGGLSRRAVPDSLVESSGRTP